MNKVQVQDVKQFPEQNYTVATDLIEVLQSFVNFY